jgi:hypothetical protein
MSILKEKWVMLKWPDSHADRPSAAARVQGR